jgi:death on curing protein
MTNFSSLDIEQALYLHKRIIDHSGGAQGERDLALLHSGLERCKATFAGEDLYPTIFDKAGALLHSLVMNHAFLDGNKRTGYEVMKRFLYINKYQIVADTEEIVALCLAVDNEGMSVRQIADWLRNHSQI